MIKFAFKHWIELILLRFVVLLLLCHWIAPSYAMSADFSNAQQAAAQGNYREVVEVLNQILNNPEVSQDEALIAHANRGIAYSLLKAYALARQDFRAALAINPEHALTLNHLGLLAEQVDANFELAATYYESAIEQGFPASLVNLAKLYHYGNGFPTDQTRAFELYRRAAEIGYDMAFVPLGEFYANGIGTKKNPAKALQLFRQASETGMPAANYHLGNAFEHGYGVKRDLTAAFQNYQKAAIQGHGEAQNALGYLYRRGHGVDQNFTKAADWYRLAADQGVAQAMNRLAWLLAGCPVESVCDAVEAIALASRAIEIGVTPGRLDSLAAAYARAGQFDDAIKTMQRVLDALPTGSDKRGVFSRRMAQYQQGIALQL